MFSNRTITRRAFLTGLAGTGAALALAACGTSSSPSGTAKNSESPNARSKTLSGTLTFMSWDDETTMRPVLEAFQKKYPRLTVQTSYVPPVTQYINTLQERLLAGTAPDVFIYTDENRAALNAHHFVRNLSDQPWVSEMADANRAFMSADGGVWGLSPASWTAGPIYNVDLLHKAGYSDTPTTWGGLITLCGKLRDEKVQPLYDSVPPPGTMLEGLVEEK
jgi:raffinose/stachyose/melibiose transport system substrate-binding protein